MDALREGHAIRSFVLWMCALGLFPLVAHGTEQCQFVDRHLRIISRRPTFDLMTSRAVVEMPEQAIAVDEDGNVLQVGVLKNGKTRILNTLGIEVVPDPHFSFSDYIPKDQVVVILRRLSCTESGWRLWIAVAAGFGASDNVKSGAFFVPKMYFYVFREDPEGKTQVITRSYYRLANLVIYDLNGDGTTEIAAQWETETISVPSTDMTMWTVMTDGSLKEISLDTIYQGLEMKGKMSSDISLGDYVHGDTSVYAIETESTASGWRKLTKGYRWNRAKGRYEFIHASTVEERHID